MARTNGTHHGAVALGGVLVFIALAILAIGSARHAAALVIAGAGLGTLGYGIDTRLSWRTPIAMLTTAVIGTAVAVALFPLGASWGEAVFVIVLGVAVTGGIAELLHARDRALIARVAQAYDQPVELARLVDRALLISRPVVFDVANELARWGRYDLVEKLATLAIVPQCESARMLYLAVALNARGNAQKAMEIARASDHTEQGAFVAEQWTQVVAQVQINLGEAAAVIGKLQGPCPVNHAITAANRQLVLADAHVALGNVDTATSIVQAVARVHGRPVLLQLREQLRPTSSIAAQLLDGATPYR
ncbi:MAG TPA: hypothetical protein VFQ53_42525 [Kofleriaceae bacterium]|nr:hypothetical protein [Kofleriaceae bacterium]